MSGARVREQEPRLRKRSGVLFMSQFDDHKVEPCPMLITWATMEASASGVAASLVEELC